MTDSKAHSHSTRPLLLAISLSCAAVCATSPAADAMPAGSGRVLVLGADGPVFEFDVQAKLQSTGLFNQVDVFDAHLLTPTLAQLMGYDAVITWSDEDYQDSVALGNVLADYVDAGGGVVLGVFTFCAVSEPTRELLGRWPTGGYAALAPHLGYLDHFNGTPAALGTVSAPNHPIMSGVTTFAGGLDSYRPDGVAFAPGAHVIAQWTDGRPLVVEHATLHQRIDLAFDPPSSDVHSTWWDSTTDGALLMGNALAYAGGSGASTTYCAGDGSATNCPCGNSGSAGHGCASSVNSTGARLESTGTAGISADSLVLHGREMPNGSALYFQGTTMTSGGAGSAFGDGLRCAGGTIVRLGAKANANGASQYPAAGDAHVSVKGVVAAPGTRTYQTWYRNAAAFCTPSTFNLSNGLEVTWTP